ncbi:hypothetical protein ACFOLJ_07445 [Rugamonas sp. CCM 8940]|uniref:hypothetical protein n=1 Tax=Rugamonas sp. CCM 8940 TaxID=2765359 RepID=UPI0018F42522|nr:hypothetical protein [Rugamonas sp. CCM 8940]MBJ7310214.1 hypothetical protein [Rugamonas sp. CCM 8940]
MKVKVKLSLFLFALGLGGSLAHAVPSCEVRCEARYNTCMKRNPDVLACRDEQLQCRHDCFDHN